MLLIDNYDSFTYNLAHLFGALGVDVKVYRNDEIDAERMAPAQLVVSPGPGRPADAGASEEIIRSRSTPAATTRSPRRGSRTCSRRRRTRTTAR